MFMKMDEIKMLSNGCASVVRGCAPFYAILVKVKPEDERATDEEKKTFNDHQNCTNKALVI